MKTVLNLIDKYDKVILLSMLLWMIVMTHAVNTWSKWPAMPLLVTIQFILIILSFIVIILTLRNMLK